MKKSRKPFWVILGINIGLIVLAALISGGGFIGGGVAALGLFAVNLLCSLVAFIAKKKDLGKAFLLAAGLCLLLSGGLCALGGPFV
jgi:uncharacterized membrane protein YhaH (DUF805 family)